MADGAGVRAESAQRLLALTVNPGDRLWRYPLCHAVIGFALRTPLTPNHVTIGHTLLGMTAGALISTGRPAMLVAAGAIYEFRSVLDCFDGVLARARGTASPYGRAMDQIGDFLGFAAFISGSWIAFSRTLGFGRAMAAYGLEQGERADQVGLHEGARVVERVVVVGLGREVDHRVDLADQPVD